MADESGAPPRPSGGIFITKGMRVGIPAGGLVIGLGKSGKPSAQVTIHVALDLSPFWLSIALDHLDQARAFNARLAIAWREQLTDSVTNELEGEFLAGMQACMSTAIAMDAFYANVKERIGLPRALTSKWRKNRTARHSQVAEVLRFAYRIGPKSLRDARQVLKDLYHWRDIAVHPASQLSAPMLHPSLGVATESRFVYFRFQNAHALVGTGLALIHQILLLPKDLHKDLVQYSTDLHTATEPLSARWKRDHASEVQATEPA